MTMSKCLPAILILFLAACRHAPERGVAAAPACNASSRITGIYKQFVYELSGYANSGGNNGYNLFDENDFFDPKNGLTGFPETSPHPIRNADNYFPRGRGSRIVADLRVPYAIGEVYLYDRSTVPDTVWIYTGDMSNWKLKATIITRGDANAYGWRKFEIADTSQYVQFRFNSPQAYITEAVLYGCPQAAVPPPPPTGGYAGATLPARTLKELVGVNMYNEIPLEWLEPFSWVRMYTEAFSFDADPEDAYPFNTVNVSRFGYLYQGNSFRHYSDDLAAVNKKMWYSLRGVPVWMGKLGYGDKDRPVTRIGMDSEDPLSYGRHAYMLWTLASVFGKSTVDSSLQRIGDMIKVSGKGTMTAIENGNEEDAWWVGNKYCTPMEYFAQSSADFDGHAGRLGARHGVYAADTNSSLIMSGTVGLDTNRVKVLDFLCRTLRPDKKFLWQGGIQYHHYSTNVKTDIAPTRWLAGTAGITPEEDSLRSRLKKVRDFTYRVQPGVECILGEYGFDKNQRSAQSTPLVPGYSAAQSQGIMLLRSVNAVSFSGFDRLILYWMKDHETEDNPNIYLTSGIVYQSLDGKVTPYPAWYYLAALMHHLGNYVPDSILSEKGNVWVYRYRHRSQPDSVALFVYAPTRKGNKYNGYELPVPAAAATEVIFEDTNQTGRSQRKQVVNGKLTLDVGEMPRIILYGK